MTFTKHLASIFMRKKTIRSALIIIGTVQAASCGSSEWHPASPATMGSTSVVVTKAVDIDAAQYAKVEKAISLLARVLQDETFWSAALRGPEGNQVQQAINGHQEDVEATSLGPDRTYAWNVLNRNGKRVPITNAEVVELLRLANEPGGSHERVVEFAIRRNRRPWAPWCGWPFYREIGHREAPNTIMTQDCMMSRMSAPDLAGHWLHEYMHILGFEHAYRDDSARQFSVPYFIGNLVVERAAAVN